VGEPEVIPGEEDPNVRYFKKKLDDSLVSHFLGGYYTVQHEDRVVHVLEQVEGPDKRDARWLRVQDVVTGAVRDLHSRSLIRKLTDMEVVAWAARTKT
jgi:hypothetical protein